MCNIRREITNISNEAFIVFRNDLRVARSNTEVVRQVRCSGTQLLARTVLRSFEEQRKSKCSVVTE